MALNLQRLPEGQAIVDKEGQAALAFVVYWQQTCEALEAQEATQDEILVQLGAQLALIAAAQADADAAGVSIISLDARIDAYDALQPFVRQDQTAAWADSSGTQARTTFAAYAGQTVSNPPTQAEVQAIDDHVKVLSERLAALVNDLRANGTLT